MGLRLLAIGALSAWGGLANAGTTYHVAPGGSDSAPGSRDQPFRSIQHAADVAGPGDTVLVHALVYRNVFHQPSLGSHVFFHWGVDDAIREGGGHSELAFYHNTFSRGSIRPGVGQRLEGTIFVNNVFSGTNWDRGVLGAVDRNFFGGVRLPAEAGAAEGFGPGNLTDGPVDGWEEAAALSDFSLPADHPARAAGIDLSQAFELGGKQRPPLPGMEPGYFDGPAPDLGIVPPPGSARSRLAD